MAFGDPPPCYCLQHRQATGGPCICGGWPLAVPHLGLAAGPPATTLVNIAHRETFEVYIGRASSCPAGFTGPGAAGQFGNPVVPGRTCPICGARHQDPGSTIPCFEEWLDRKLAAEPDFLEPLRGKRLGCFCVPKPCHGEAYLERLESPASTDALAERLMRGS